MMLPRLNRRVLWGVIVYRLFYVLVGSIILLIGILTKDNIYVLSFIMVGCGFFGVEFLCVFLLVAQLGCKYGT